MWGSTPFHLREPSKATRAVQGGDWVLDRQRRPVTEWTASWGGVPTPQLLKLRVHVNTQGLGLNADSFHAVNKVMDLDQRALDGLSALPHGVMIALLTGQADSPTQQQPDLQQGLILCVTHTHPNTI